MLKPPLPSIPQRILVGEDNFIVQHVMSSWLSEWNKSFTLSKTCKELVQAVSESHYDLLLLDYHLDVEAPEVINALRDLPLGKDLPIVLLSAENETWVSEQLKEHSLKGILKKPIDPKKLKVFLDGPDVPEALDFDLTTLQNLQQNPERVKKIIALFIEEVPLNIQKMKELSGHCDWAALKALVHRTKPAFGYLGIDDLYDRLSECEDGLKLDGPPQNLMGTLNEIEKKTFQIIEKLKQTVH